MFNLYFCTYSLNSAGSLSLDSTRFIFIAPVFFIIFMFQVCIHERFKEQSSRACHGQPCEPFETLNYRHSKEERAYYLNVTTSLQTQITTIICEHLYVTTTAGGTIGC